MIDATCIRLKADASDMRLGASMPRANVRVLRDSSASGTSFMICTASSAGTGGNPDRLGRYGEASIEYELMVKTDLIIKHELNVERVDNAKHGPIIGCVYPSAGHGPP